jgi:hypothetical protein
MVWRSTSVHTPYTWATARSKQLAQKIDHSFGPRSLTGIYLGKDTIHGKEKHIITTSTQDGTTHYTRTCDRLGVCVDIIPLWTKFEIPNTEVQTALLTMTEESFEYFHLDSLTFVASARIVKHQAKHQNKKGHSNTDSTIQSRNWKGAIMKWRRYWIKEEQWGIPHKMERLRFRGGLSDKRKECHTVYDNRVPSIPQE